MGMVVVQPTLYLKNKVVVFTFFNPKAVFFTYVYLFIPRNFCLRSNETRIFQKKLRSKTNFAIYSVCYCFDVYDAVGTLHGNCYAYDAYFGWYG